MTNININVKWIIIAVFVLSVVGMSYATPIIGDTITAVRFVTSEGFNSSNVTQGVRTIDSPAFAGINATNLTGHLNASNYNITLAQKFTSKLYEVLDSSLVTIASYVDAYSCDGSYCIYQPWYAPGQVYAKNMSTGKVDYSGTDASTVINSTVNFNISRKTWAYFRVSGAFSMGTVSVDLPEFTVLDNSGSNFTLKSGANKAMISINNKSSVWVSGGAYDGNAGAQASDSKIFRVAADSTDISNIRLMNIEAYNSNGHAIYVGSLSGCCHVSDSIFDNIYAHEGGSAGSDGGGVTLYRVRNSIASNIISYNNSLDGLQLMYGNDTILSNINAWDNARTDIRIGQSTSIPMRNITLDNFRVSGGPAGLLLDYSVDGAVVSNGVIRNITAGIGYAVTLNSSNSVLSNLYVDNNKYGLYIRDFARNNTIYGSTFLNSSTKTINEVSGADYNWIHDNTMWGGTTTLTGTNTTVTNNRGLPGFNHGNKANCTTITPFGKFDTCGNTTNNKLMFYNGTAWETVTSS